MLASLVVLGSSLHLRQDSHQLARNFDGLTGEALVTDLGEIEYMNRENGKDTLDAIMAESEDELTGAASLQDNEGESESDAGEKYNYTGQYPRLETFLGNGAV